jgi:hypothetical protein
MKTLRTVRGRPTVPSATALFAAVIAGEQHRWTYVARPEPCRASAASASADSTPCAIGLSTST